MSQCEINIYLLSTQMAGATCAGGSIIQKATKSCMLDIRSREEQWEVVEGEKVH